MDNVLNYQINNMPAQFMPVNFPGNNNDNGAQIGLDPNRLYALRRVIDGDNVHGPPPPPYYQQQQQPNQFQHMPMMQHQQMPQPQRMMINRQPPLQNPFRNMSNNPFNNVVPNQVAPIPPPPPRRQPRQRHPDPVQVPQQMNRPNPNPLPPRFPLPQLGPADFIPAPTVSVPSGSGNPVETSQTSAVSTCYAVKSVSFSHKMRITNFSKLSDSFIDLRSDEFGPQEDPSLRFCLWLFTDSRATADSLSLYVISTRCMEFRDVKFKFSIVSDDKTESKEAGEISYGFRYQGDGLGFTNWIQRSITTSANDELLFKNDSLNIVCEGSAYMLVKEQEPRRKRKAASSFRAEWLKIYESKQLSDCSVKVQDKVFPAHKIVLSARSNFFEQRFSENWNESSEIKLDDFEADDFEQVLRYIYTSEVPKSSRVTVQMLAISDYLLMDEFKEICEDALRRTLNVENVCERLVSADQSSADDLFQACIDFINSKRAEVVKLDSSRELLSTRPSLLYHLFESSAQH